jgi:hypothetical protein
LLLTCFVSILAQLVLNPVCSDMKSNRINFYKASHSLKKSLATFSTASASLADMPPPQMVASISADQVVSDILVATLLRVQESANAEVAEAVERYLAILR